MTTWQWIGVAVAALLFFWGVGAYNRLMSLRNAIGEAEWLELLAARLRQAIARRKPMLNTENDACRLCFSEADSLPGIVVDKYAGLTILQLLAKGLDSQQVREACVFGIPHEKWGEQVHAVVVAEGITGEEIIAYAKDRLGGVKAPKSVEFVPEIPRTAAGKMDKKALRVKYWGDAQRMVN